MSQFLQRNRISKEEFDSTGLVWEDLESIYEHHVKKSPGLLSEGLYIAGMLQQVPQVHSYKVRVKDPEHLVAKIVRKKLAHPDRSYTPDNFERQVTDLVGVRALHLFKGDWESIHDFVSNTWDLVEAPIVYIREGDGSDLQERLSSVGCKVAVHPFGYRSVHYLLSTSPTKVARVIELQVRTIFEEGWSEIDHRVRYPSNSDDRSLKEFLQIFNRLAGSADEMGTFISALSTRLHQHATDFESMRSARQELESRLDKTVSELKISEKQRRALRKQIDELRGSVDNQPLSLGQAVDPMPTFGSLGSLTDAMSLGAIQQTDWARWGVPTLASLSASTEHVCTGCGRRFEGSPGFFVGAFNLCEDCRARVSASSIGSGTKSST